MVTVISGRKLPRTHYLPPLILTKICSSRRYPHLSEGDQLSSCYVGLTSSPGPSGKPEGPPRAALYYLQGIKV